MLMCFARFLGIVDTPSAEEIAIFTREQTLNEQALKRKRESEVAELKPRLRAKILQHIQHEKEMLRAQNQHSNSQFESFIVNNYKSLDLSILSIYLYARHCLLFDNYDGVYVRELRAAKQTSLLLATAQSALMGGRNTPKQSMTDLHASDASPRPVDGKSDPKTENQIYTIPASDIPTHLCIGENCVNYIPLDRAVRVIRVFTSFLSPQQLMAVYHSFENHAVFLFPDGRLDLPEGISLSFQLLFS